ANRGGGVTTESPTAGSPTTQSPAVELRGITKRFPGVVANHDIMLTVRRGTIHAIVGENGAGKSTLMKILYGMQRPEGGGIFVGGRGSTSPPPHRPISAGMGWAHQHFMPADTLPVGENIALGGEKLHGMGDGGAREIREISRQYGLGVDPDALMEDLGV